MDTDAALVVFPTAGFSRQTRCRVQRSMAGHDVFTFDVVDLPGGTDHDALVTGTPFYVDWGRTSSFSRSAIYYGYVLSSRPKDNVARSAGAVVTGVGISSVLRTKRQKQWVAGVEEVVKTLCAEQRLNAVVDLATPPAPRESIAQDGVSDWDFLKRLADEYGALLFVDGATVFFTSRERCIDRAVTRGEIVTVRPTLPPKTDAGAVSRGTALRQYQGYTLDPKSGVLHAIDPGTERRAGRTLGGQTDDPWIGDFLPGPAGETPARASEILAAANERSRWYLRSSCTLGCLPEVGPGTVVFVAPAEFRYASTDSGAWLVEETVHERGKDTFRSTLSLVRDARGWESFQARPTAPEQTQQGVPIGSLPDAQLLGTTWVSTWSSP
jgi:hypothetical protein